MTETQENKVPAHYRRFIAGGAAALAVFAGGVGIAAAQSSPKPSGPRVTAPSATAPHDADSHDSDDKPDATSKSSITSPELPDSAAEENETPAQETFREAVENASLAKLATVTPEQARGAALKAVPGTIVYEDGAKAPQVSNEDGNVVYEITINSANGKTQTEVTIDAGNAKVLATEVDHAEAHEAAGD